jgi:hypothetical protein
MLDIPSKLSVSSHVSGLTGKRIPQKKKRIMQFLVKEPGASTWKTITTNSLEAEVAGGRLHGDWLIRYEGQHEQFTVNDLVQELKWPRQTTQVKPGGLQVKPGGLQQWNRDRLERSYRLGPWKYILYYWVLGFAGSFWVITAFLLLTRGAEIGASARFQNLALCAVVYLVGAVLFGWSMWKYVQNSYEKMIESEPEDDGADR